MLALPLFRELTPSSRHPPVKVLADCLNILYAD